MKWTRLLSVLAVVALAAVACGEGDTGSPTSDPAATSPAASAHNEADIEFVQGMIPHHEQAIEMSDLALERSDNPEVVDLAERIKAAQGPESMLSDEELTALGAAEGASFDRLFLNGMIAHHRGAVTTSQTELQEGESAEAKELAQAIIDAQQAEIAEMEQLLSRA